MQMGEVMTFTFSRNDFSKISRLIAAKQTREAGRTQVTTRDTWINFCEWLRRRGDTFKGVQLKVQIKLVEQRSSTAPHVGFVLIKAICRSMKYEIGKMSRRCMQKTIKMNVHFVRRSILNFHRWHFMSRPSLPSFGALRKKHIWDPFLRSSFRQRRALGGI